MYNIIEAKYIKSQGENASLYTTTSVKIEFR